jgi:maleylacetate reductase
MSAEFPLSFVFEASPARVVFGRKGIDKASEEVDRLAAARVLIIATPGRRKLVSELRAQLGSKVAGIFDRAVMHVPIETAEAARAEAARVNADCYLAIGGSSTTGVAKAIALVAPRPILCIPTTYAGSEMTSIWGLTEGDVKKTGRDLRVRPATVIYDPDLTVSMPAVLSATSGMNAMAHCVEALYAQDANPVVSLIAEEGIRALSRSLPAVVKKPTNMKARSLALYGAWLGAYSLGAVGMALHHKLCHTLGRSFGLPHAETHTVLLPHTTAYNSAAAPEPIARVARALAAKSAAAGLYDLAAGMGAPLSLESLGMKRADLDRAADLAVRNPYYNPRPLSKEGIRHLLEDAFEGRLPHG